jgi:hypothetical protein
MRKLERIRKNECEPIEGREILFPVICAVIDDLNFSTTAQITGKRSTVSQYGKANFKKKTSGSKKNVPFSTCILVHSKVNA